MIMMMKHRMILLLLAMSLVCGLCACAAPTEADASARTDEPPAAREEAAPSVSEGAETVVQFTGEAVSVSGSGCEADGTALTISEGGVYRLSGNCTDGSVKVKMARAGVTLILDGLTLTSADTASITCGRSSQVTIEAAAGTVNMLSDSEQNNDDMYPTNENAENAVLKCKDGSQVTLCGTGVLTITANGKNGIKSGASTDEDGEASLTIRELTLTIDAPVNDAINAGQLPTHRRARASPASAICRAADQAALTRTAKRPPTCQTVKRRLHYLTTAARLPKNRTAHRRPQIPAACNPYGAPRAPLKGELARSA